MEADEAYLGGTVTNKHLDTKLNSGCGAVGKTPVMSLKDRETHTIVAEPVQSAHRASAEKLIGDSVSPEAQVYTDTSRIYDGLHPRRSVNHSFGEYARGEMHANGIESFRALLKRGYHGTCHSMSRKHLHRYVNEFAGRYNRRGKSLLDRGQGTKQRFLWPLPLRRSPAWQPAARCPQFPRHGGIGPARPPGSHLPQAPHLPQFGFTEKRFHGRCRGLGCSPGRRLASEPSPGDEPRPALAGSALCVSVTIAPAWRQLAPSSGRCTIRRPLTSERV